ncbi:MAG: hypothetical protein ACOCSR_02855 [Wenzhouxiangella sp.]
MLICEDRVPMKGQYTQPCSQPRYGLIDRSKGASGDWLHEMIEAACPSKPVHIISHAPTGILPPADPVLFLAGPRPPIRFPENKGVD